MRLQKSVATKQSVIELHLCSNFCSYLWSSSWLSKRHKQNSAIPVRARDCSFILRVRANRLPRNGPVEARLISQLVIADKSAYIAAQSAEERFLPSRRRQ